MSIWRGVGSLQLPEPLASTTLQRQLHSEIRNLALAFRVVWGQPGVKETMFIIYA